MKGSVVVGAWIVLKLVSRPGVSELVDLVEVAGKDVVDDRFIKKKLCDVSM
jgi:hypothetical protein